MSKKKSCFVIMPISDQAGYEQGHFAKVYEDIIEPAVAELDYEPVLASKVASTNLIHADIINRLINADLAICDLSANNPNVMFELGIRQAFDKPVFLINDDATSNPFDISIIRYQEYDSKLSYRGVNSARAAIVSAITATLNAKGSDVNSIVKLLGLQAAAIPVMNEKPEDARFALIEQALGKISEQMRGLRQEIRSKPATKLPALSSWVDSGSQGGILGNTSSGDFVWVPTGEPPTEGYISAGAPLGRGILGDQSSTDTRKKPSNDKKD
jgi:hypothetical protein